MAIYIIISAKPYHRKLRKTYAQGYRKIASTSNKIKPRPPRKIAQKTAPVHLPLVAHHIHRVLVLRGSVVASQLIPRQLSTCQRGLLRSAGVSEAERNYIGRNRP